MGRITDMVIDIAARGIVFVFSLLALGLLLVGLYWAPGTFFGFPHVEYTGQVSSIRSIQIGAICTTTIEFYGGMNDEVWCNPMTQNITPNRECTWVGDGMWVKVASCTNKTN